MRSVQHTRRGMVLLMVVVVIAFVGGVITLLAAHAAAWYRDGRQDRREAVAQAVTDSVVLWAEAHRAELAASPPAASQVATTEPKAEEPVTTQPETVEATTSQPAAVVVDIASLLPGGFTGTARVLYRDENGQPIRRILTSVASGGIAVEKQVDLAP